MVQEALYRNLYIDNDKGYYNPSVNNIGLTQRKIDIDNVITVAAAIKRGRDSDSNKFTNTITGKPPRKTIRIKEPLVIIDDNDINNDNIKEDIRVKKPRQRRVFRYTQIMSIARPFNALSIVRNTKVTIKLGEFLDYSPYAIVQVSKLLIRE